MTATGKADPFCLSGFPPTGGDSPVQNAGAQAELQPDCSSGWGRLASGVNSGLECEHC